MDKGSFYLFIVLLSTTSNHSEKLKCFKCSSWHIRFRGSSLPACAELSNLSELAFNIFDKNINVPCVSYQRTQQMLFHYLSFDKHFSSSSIQDKSRVFSHIKVKIETYNQKLYIAYKLELWNSEIWNSKFCKGIRNTCRRLIPWWNLSKIFVLKHFAWDVLHKESFSTFLFTICVLKSVFCWDISVPIDRDQCEKIKVETQRKMSETRS